MQSNITPKRTAALALSLLFATSLFLSSTSFGQDRQRQDQKQSGDKNAQPKQQTPPVAHARRDAVKTKDVPARTNTHADQGTQRTRPTTPPRQTNPPNRDRPPVSKYPPIHPPMPVTRPPADVRKERDFTRSTQGKRYDNGARLRPAMPTRSSWQRPYFPQGHAYYPYYQPRYNSMSVFISPFGFYYGVTAPYISRSHGYNRRPSIVYVEIPIYNGSNYNGYQNYNGENYFNDRYLGDREPGLLNAIDEIQEAYQGGNIDSLVAVTDPNTDIAIFLNGQYSYSMPANDYLDLARDAIDSTRTDQFNLTMLHKRSEGVFVASGQHVYQDQNGRDRSVYVSYVLEDIQGQWTLTQVGTTPDRLQNWN